MGDWEGKGWGTDACVGLVRRGAARKEMRRMCYGRWCFSVESFRIDLGEKGFWIAGGAAIEYGGSEIA